MPHDDHVSPWDHMLAPIPALEHLSSFQPFQSNGQSHDHFCHMTNPSCPSAMDDPYANEHGWNMDDPWVTQVKCSRLHEGHCARNPDDIQQKHYCWWFIVHLCELVPSQCLRLVPGREVSTLWHMRMMLDSFVRVPYFVKKAHWSNYGRFWNGPRHFQVTFFR